MKCKRLIHTNLLLLLLAIAGMTGCAHPKPDLDVPSHAYPKFSESGVRQAPSRWWTAFGDEALNEQVDRALRNNFNLETAWQRLQEAQAVADREASGLFPDVEAFGETEAGRTPPEDDEQRLRLGLASRYELDLWGRIRAESDAERYRSAATHADYRAAALSLSAEVARTWFQLLEAGRQLELVENQIDTNRKVLRLIENRFGIGQTRSADILRQRQLVESSREQKITVESAIRGLENRLAVLEGRPPQSGVRYRPDKLPALPPLPGTGLPADLIRRRPDVEAAFRRLQAADRDLAAAVSNQYPRLTLTASVSSTEESVGDLFVDWAYAIAGDLVAPLFDGGRRKAEVSRTEARKRQRFSEYTQTVLVAFQEVEDALIQENKQRKRIDSLREQLDLARRTYQRLRVEYFNGLSGYIDVLLALTEDQRLRRDLLTEKRRLLEFRIALYRALAGGFPTEREKKT